MKKYASRVEKKVLVSKLSEILGERMNYSGVPRFEYTLRGFTIDRAGNLLAEDDTDMEVVTQLAEAGLIEVPQTEELVEAHTQTVATEETVDSETNEVETVEETDDEAEAESGNADSEELDMNFELPMGNHTGVSLRNLVYLIYSRAEQLGRSTGAKFSVSEKLVEALKDDACTLSAAHFRKALSDFEAVNGKGMEGLEILEDRVVFCGFPKAPDKAHLTAYSQLVALMNNQAISQKRILAKQVTSENERYSFRIFLIRLGMNGDAFKQTRMILLKDLPGSSAFSTPEQAQAFLVKEKQKRDALRAAKMATKGAELTAAAEEGILR